MWFIYLSQVFGKIDENVLRALYVRPKANTYEIYPLGHLDLCFGICKSKDNTINKCDTTLFQINNSVVNTKTYEWCQTNISSKNLSKIISIIKNKYQITFSTGTGKKSALIGKGNSSIFTHYNFQFSRKGNKFKLANVITSNPINVSVGVYNFTYSLSYGENNSRPYANTKDIIFTVVLFVIVLVSLIFVLRPRTDTRMICAVVAAIPSGSFLLVMFCGSGLGVIIFTAVIGFIAKFKLESIFRPQILFTFAPACSSLGTSIATSILCSVWRLKDLASALYFAPLLIPSLALCFVFSVQWIPVCVGSCLSIPLKLIFYFIISVVFVKLPVNLVTSLVTNILYRPLPYTHLLSVPVRKLIRSRKVFLILSNVFYFIIVFPAIESSKKLLEDGFSGPDWANVVMRFILWIVTSALTGISSVALGTADDWAAFAFLSAGSSAAVIFIVVNIIGIFAGGMNGTLQLSVNAAVSGLVCTCIGLGAGAISVLSALTYILKMGNPAKSA